MELPWEVSLRNMRDFFLLHDSSLQPWTVLQIYVSPGPMQRSLDGLNALYDDGRTQSIFTKCCNTEGEQYSWHASAVYNKERLPFQRHYSALTALLLPGSPLCGNAPHLSPHFHWLTPLFPHCIHDLLDSHSSFPFAIFSGCANSSHWDWIEYEFNSARSKSNKIPNIFFQ